MPRLPNIRSRKLQPMAEIALEESPGTRGSRRSFKDSSLQYKAKFIQAGPAELEVLTPEWENLVEDRALSEPFFQPYWFRSLAQTINDGRPFPLVVVRDGSTLRGILPLVRQRRLFGKLPAVTLTSLSNVHSCRYDFVCPESDRDEIARAAWTSLKTNRHWSVIEATAVPQGGAFESIMDHAERDGYHITRWPTLLSPYVELPVGSSDAYKNCPARYKKDRKRLQRHFDRLKESGEPPFAVFTTFDEAIFQEFLRLEGSGWRGKAGGAISCDPKLVKMHRDMLAGASDAGHLRICTLRVNEQCIAMELAFLIGDRCYSPKITYNEEFARYSPGQLLARWVIEDLVKRDVSLYDLLGARARNKALWAGTVRPHANCYIFRPSIVGKFYHFLTARFAPELKKAKYARYGDPQSIPGD